MRAGGDARPAAARRRKLLVLGCDVVAAPAATTPSPMAKKARPDDAPMTTSPPAKCARCRACGLRLRAPAARR
jgi:hypothetical protein